MEAECKKIAGMLQESVMQKSQIFDGRTEDGSSKLPEKKFTDEEEIRIVRLRREHQSGTRVRRTGISDKYIS